MLMMMMMLLQLDILISAVRFQLCMDTLRMCSSRTDMS